VTRKKLAGAAAVGAATAAAALLIGSTTAVADEEVRSSSAYGVAASGLLPIAPIPAAEWNGGPPVRTELIGLSESDVAGVVALSARVLTAEASEDAAESSVVDVEVVGLLEAKLVRTHCADGEGGLQIVEGTLLGTELPDTSVPNEEIDVSPLVSVTLNNQRRDADGALTVEGIVLKVLPGAGGNLDRPLAADERAALPELGELLGADLPETLTSPRAVADELGGVGGPGRGDALQTIVIGSATCGGDLDEDQDEDGDDGEDEDLPEAPAPEIVEADLPVTG